MNRSDHLIVVTGATGHQGGAAARHILADGWRVRAIVRDPAKPASRALAEAGAELFVGNLDDRASVDAALAGAYGVHSVQSLAEGPEAEFAQGKNLGDAAKAAGVEHFVYSSVIGADRPSLLPWVSQKAALELYLRGLDIPLTIFRPTTFMEAFAERQHETLLGGKISGFEPPDVAHQWIAVDDIGRFIALAFFAPQTWLGTATEIAGDELTGEQAAAAFAFALGFPVRYEQMPPMPGMPAPDPDAPAPNRADIPRLRESIPDLRTLAEWALEEHAAGRL